MQLEMDTQQKFTKIVHAVTQSLWHVILEIREGKLDRQSAVPFVDILMTTLKAGKQNGFTLTEIDQWWCREVLEAFDRLD